MEQIILNLVPGGVSPVCYVSQYDVGRKIRLHLRNGSDPYVLSGAETVTATIRKVSGEELIYDIANTSASYVDLIVNYDATDVIGESVCELIIAESGIRLGSANFKMRVDPDVYSGDQKLEVVSATSENPDLSFETNVEENLLELKAGFSPVQDLHGYDSPWIDSNVVNKKPYLLRAIAGTASRIGTHEYNKIVGGTVAWNQLAKTSGLSALTANGITFTPTANGITVQNTATDLANYDINVVNYVQNHIYYVSGIPQGASDSGYYLFAFLYKRTSDFIIKPNRDDWFTLRIRVESGTVINTPVIFKPNIFDLTQMFGSTIADYIYSLEQATAGAGVAWFKALFPNDYYAYNAGELISVKTSAHNTIGFNQWDEEWELGSINFNTGVKQNDNTKIRTKDFNRCLPGTEYCFRKPIGMFARLCFYDVNQEFISSPDVIYTQSLTSIFTTPANACYFMFILATTSYSNNVCVNFHSGFDGQYQPYVSHSYPLDSDLELRGIPKLDANNNLYYDGDTYESDGKVTRSYNYSEYDGSVDEDWRLQSINSYGIANFSLSHLQFANADDTIANRFIIQTSLIANTQTEGYLIASLDTLYIRILASKASTVEDFRTWLSSNKIQFAYKKATPTTETADPFTNPQEIDPNGSEEFVDTRSVAIPVGHESYYANICEIEGWNEVNVQQTGVNLWDETWDDCYWNEDANGVKVYNTSMFGCNSHISVCAGTNICFVSPSVNPRWFVLWYDANKEMISYERANGGDVLTVPADACYMTFYTSKVAYSSTYNNDISINLPSTDTTYHPYTGKLINLDWNTNQWDEEWEIGGINNSTGQNEQSNARIRSVNYIKVTPNEMYYLKGDNAFNYVMFYAIDYSYLSYVVNKSNQVVTVPNNAYYMRFVNATAYGTTYNHDISINYPSTDHTYHPYRGHGVAYNGEVVYKDGGWKLRLLSKEVDLGTLSWAAGFSGYYTQSLQSLVKIPPTYYDNDFVCEVFSFGNTSGASQAYFQPATTAYGGLFVALPSGTYEDTTAFKNAMSGIQLVYPLATPIEIPLDQNSKLATVLGINNLMHDSNGGTEVKFFRMISAS